MTPVKRLIGDMGWLLSCRQAYVEDIEVLYGTNRLHIEGKFLLCRLLDLLLPQRIAAIKMVQLQWPMADGTTRFRGGHPPLQYIDGFIPLLKLLPRALPSLTSLYLSLQGYQIL